MGYVVDGCNAVATEHGRMVCLVCRNCGVHELCMLGLYGKLEFKVMLLLDVAHRIVSYVEGYGVSSAEYCVHLVGVKSFVVCIVGKWHKM